MVTTNNSTLPTLAEQYAAEYNGRFDAIAYRERLEDDKADSIDRREKNLRLDEFHRLIWEKKVANWTFLARDCSPIEIFEFEDGTLLAIPEGIFAAPIVPMGWPFTKA